MSSRLLLVLAATFDLIIGSVASADQRGSLSLEQIVELKTAGVGDTVIAHQIELSGISFAPDASALLTLRKSGLTDNVLDAVVKAASVPPRQLRRMYPTKFSDQVADLYKAKKYPEVADLLFAQSRTNALSERNLAVLVLSLLKLDNLAEAKVQSGKLSSEYPNSSFGSKLTTVLDQAYERQRLRPLLDSAIKRLSYRDAIAVIENSRLVESDKRDLLVDAAVAGADFDHARTLLGADGEASYVEKSRLKAREVRLQEQEKQFQAVRSDVDKFVYSRGALSACGGQNGDSGIYYPESGRGVDFTVQAYLEAVRRMVSAAPLSDETLSRVFHATLISSKYQDVERLGDEILTASGQLRITGFGSDRFVTLIIDRAGRRLSTEADNHPVSVTAYPASKQPVVQFNLGFDDITGLSQDAREAIMIWPVDRLLNDGAIAIKLRPNGQIPQYPLMTFLDCSLGHNAQLAATYNLGAYIRHAVNIDPKRASLVSPGTDQKPGGLGFASFLAGAGMALGVSGSSELLQTAEAAHEGAVSAENRRLELVSQGRFDFSVAQSTSVQELESSLGMVAETVH